MRFLVLAATALTAAGCTTTPPPAPEPDNTPTHPTAVIETYVTTNGLKGLFPLEMDERRFVRVNMSREENVIKGTGRFTGFLVNMFGPNDDAVIDRLDRKRHWALDLRKRQYTECPLSGCATPQGVPPAEQQKPPKAERESGCVPRISKKSFTVTPTGRKRAINGFDASEYRVAWIVTLRDKAGRSSTSTLKMEIWTTPVSAAMRAALRIDQTYARAYAAAVHGANAGAVDLSQPVPPEVGNAMLAYIGELNAGDRAALLAVGKQLQRIKGHPIRSRIDWDFEGNACAAADSDGGSAGSAGSIFSGFTSLFSGKKKGEQSGAREPLFSFTYEIRSLKVEPVHDGMFAVPAGYQRVNP
jgi:hypothetical protein